MFYIGKHLGSINDGYICSSKMMLRDYKKNPDHFKRRILHYFIDPTGSLSLEKECPDSDAAYQSGYPENGIQVSA